MPAKGVLHEKERETIQEHLNLSEHVYQDRIKPGDVAAGGWQRVFSSVDVQGLGDRGFFGALYQRNVNGRTENAIIFRGVDGALDIDDAFMLAVGKTPRQFRDAYEFSQIAIAKFNLSPAQIHFAGHSMGGYLSKAVGLMVGSENIYAFNSPGLFAEDMQRLPRKVRRHFENASIDLDTGKIDKNVTSVDSKWDIVSTIGPHKGRTIQLETMGGPHSIASLRDAFTEEANPAPAQRGAHGANLPQQSVSWALSFG